MKEYLSVAYGIREHFEKNAVQAIYFLCKSSA